PGGGTVRLRFAAGLAASIIVAGATRPAAAQSDPPSIDLVVNAGRPLRIALDERVPLKRVGQPVMVSVTESVYAYDRVVVPAGTKVRGHVAQIASGSKLARGRAYLNGNFSPPRRAVVQFDALLLDDGRE